MDHERHKEILTLLNNPELSQSEKTDLLDELRTGGNALFTTVAEQEQKIAEQKKLTDDLTNANGKLFLKLNEQDGNEDDDGKEPENKVIPLSELLKGKEVQY